MNDIPVILVCYNRPWHTAQVLKALLEHQVQNLYIFSDAPKTAKDTEGVLATRRLFKAVRWTRPKIVERQENLGLARSIVSAVDQVFQENDRLILLEDDCVPRKYFFDFIAKCLSKYEDNEKVFGINGYTVRVPRSLLADYPYDIYFYPRIGSWGWATWKRAWRHYDSDLARLYNQTVAKGIDITRGGTDIPESVRRLLNGQLKDVWTLNWVLSVYLRDGCYIYPTTSQIRNIGLDGTGVHCGATRQFDNFDEERQALRFPDDVVLNEALIDNYNSYFGRPAKRPKAGGSHRIATVQATAGRLDGRPGRVGESRGKLSILHINTHDRAGGAAKVAWRLAHSQRSAGHHSKMLVGEKTTDSEHSCSFPVGLDKELQVQCMREGGLYYEFQGSHRLVYHPFVRSADVLHLHNMHGGYFNPYSLSSLSHLKPTVWTLHDMQAITGHCAHSFDCRRWKSGCGQCPYLQVYPHILVDTSARLCRDKKQVYEHSYLTIVTPSQWLKDKVEKSILQNHPVELIYNGVDTEIFKPYDRDSARRRFGIPADVLTVGTVAHGGALSNFWKGGEFTRATLQALENTQPDYVFVNIGGQHKTDNPRIISIPPIDDENELAQAYSMLDMFLYTPAADNCPLVVLEALSCGVPIVTFGTGGIPELVRDGTDGFVLNPGDVPAMTKAVVKLATAPQLRAEYTRNARNRALSQFDHRQIADRYQSLYERCLKRRVDTPVRARFFSFAGTPRVVLTEAFLRAEDSKRELASDSTSESAAGHQRASEAPLAPKLTVVTSIAPKEIEKQARAIESWTKLGLDVVSMNCPREIDALRKSFPSVKFVEAGRTAGAVFGRPLVYLDDILDYCSNEASAVCGIINSDIFLTDDKTAISFIQKEAANALVYGSRVDVESLGAPNGEVYEGGFDFFFFDKSLISDFPKSDYCIGAPWWDYWLPLNLALQGVEIKKLVSPFACHIRHTFKWDKEQWISLAEHRLEYLVDNINKHLHRNPDSDPWACLGRLFSNYHNQELSESNRENTDKVSGDILCRSVLEFLKISAREISHPKNVPVAARRLGTCRPEKKDIFIHKDARQVRPEAGLAAACDVSIVVCTKDRASLLDRMLASLKEAVRGTSYEVIAVEGGSEDNTLEVLRKHGVTKVYSEAEWLGPGKHCWPALYNFGFSKAKGRYGMYASDDIVFGKGAISWAAGALRKQQDSVAGGIFFYKNLYADPGWERYGIDFMYGSRLLMNYGLVRMDHFRQVGGFDEAYRFYCADSDLCCKLYEKGKQLIPLPTCFVAHINFFDKQKQANDALSGRDIACFLERWSHFVPRGVPVPRRLLWADEFLEVFELPADLGSVDSAIESFWFGLACFQQGFFQKAKAELIKALESHCDQWQVLWYLARTADMCGEKSLAEQAARSVLKLAPQFVGAQDFLRRLGSYAGHPPGPGSVRAGHEKTSKTLGARATDTLAALVFSKDRAMQLRAVIESFLLHCADSHRARLCVLYTTSSRLHARQYEKLKQQFPNVCFIRETDFKEQVLTVISESEHVLFLVDDTLFVADFHLADVLESLRSNSDAIGFSLRLGRNTNYCYAHNANQCLPAFRQVTRGILKYDWTIAQYDFGYPLEVSSSLYACRDIVGLLKRPDFANPNTLEGLMAASAALYKQTRGSLLCYENSAAFSDPVNLVQSVHPNRVGVRSEYSVDRLAELFDEGVSIDVRRYSGLVPESCHHEMELFFRDSERAIGESAAVPARADLYDREEQTSRPRFSVIMANYNNARYVGQAIESVCSQTFGDFELIIVEDCSTDGSLEVIDPYLKDRRIRLIRHEENRGYTAALKTGIAHVRSDYFGILDSDDCLMPHALETMHRWHVENQDCGLIYSQFVFCDEGLAQKRIGFCTDIRPGETSLDANVVSHFKTFKLRDYLGTSGYDENILYAEDVDIVYKMEEVTRLRFVDECLYLYREVPTSLCHSKARINVSIMSRVKARINALKRRCLARAASGGVGFEQLFREAVTAARRDNRDVEQYFVIITKLYETGMLETSLLPAGAEKWHSEDAVLWLAANLDVQFDKLFELIERHRRKDDGPLVTVEMVTYNAERFIAKAISSVLAQTHANFELLIVDDGSTDRTAEIISSFSDRRIRYVHTPHKNCASARNRAIAEARGQYLLCVDSDDFIEADYIEKMLACALRNPQVDYFYPAGLALVDEAGRAASDKWEYLDFSDNTNLPAFLFENAYGPIPNPGSLKRRALFDRIGMYDDVDSVEDFTFLCRNALKIKFRRVEDHSTYFYRRLPTSSSHNFNARDRIIAKMLNDMVSVYPPQVLCPQAAGISDPAARQHKYFEYLMTVFYKHARGKMVQCGEHFRRYGDFYKLKLQIAKSAEPVGSAEHL